MKPNQHSALIPSDPREAGSDFHRLLLRMADSGPLVDRERAYLPWLTPARKFIWNLGVTELEIEKKLHGFAGLPNGVCDLLAHGGPQALGPIEVKVIRNGSLDSPRHKDLAQLGAYARLAASHRSFDRMWAALLYVEIENKRICMRGFSSARGLIETSVALIRAA